MTYIKLHNTLSGETEEFKPITAGEVKMYHCGPTVYNYLHIGNLRAYLLADLLRRMFEANRYKVTQIINITDVGHLSSTNDEGLGDDGEDKIEKMAKAKGQSAHEIADFFTDVFFTDIHSLNVNTAGTLFPKASDHIAEQIEMIKDLEAKGLTYRTSDGVYFDTSKFPGYGKLGNIDLEGLKAGARVEAHPEKKNITDFALWKFSPAASTGEKRQQEWESPWGIGFPGWHIECSAMSIKYLGQTFDVHTGGIDHIPVHHNNEIAQSESFTGKPFAHYWLHNAFVNVADGKMSKSKDNFIRLQTLIDEGISPLGYRYWLMTAHYSSQVQFGTDAVKAAEQAYKRLIELLADAPAGGSASAAHVEEALAHMSTDLDTPKVLALIWNITKDSSLSAKDKRATILAIDPMLGLDLENQISRLSVSESDITPEVRELLEKRTAAREAKDWSASDALRDEIQKHGFAVKDTEDGQKLHRA